MKKTINSTNLFVAKVKNIIHNDNDSIEIGSYNAIGYRLFYKKNDREYIDILSRVKYRTFSDDLKTGTLFVLNPKPLFKYAKSLHIEENVEDVEKYALFVDKVFNANMHDKTKWYSTKDYVHKIHHQNATSLDK